MLNSLCMQALIALSACALSVFRFSLTLVCSLPTLAGVNVHLLLRITLQASVEVGAP